MTGALLNRTNMFSRAGQMLRGIGLSRAVTVGATVGLTSSSASYCSTAAPTTQVRIAQYNILSDSLDAPDHYIHCDPNDLDHEIRFQRVAAKLEEQMRAGAVLCLQEVTTPDSSPFLLPTQTVAWCTGKE